jgi:hypothetical protein
MTIHGARVKALCLLLTAMTLSGCGKADSDPGPGGVTVGEARALDEAAAMLDERRPPAEALQPSQEQTAPDDTASAAAE